MNWHTFFIVVWAAQTVSTLFAMYHHFKYQDCAERYIDGLKKEKEIWGRCCYTYGYIDAVHGNEPQFKTEAEVLAEIEEKKNADQTV